MKTIGKFLVISALAASSLMARSADVQIEEAQQHQSSDSSVVVVQRIFIPIPVPGLPSSIQAYLLIEVSQFGGVTVTVVFYPTGASE